MNTTDWPADVAEDPRELGKRRDLWLLPNSYNMVARMLMLDMEGTAVRKSVPARQAGFTRNANAPAQTLVLRAHQERCRELRQNYFVAFVDMGTFFMSICKDIAILAAGLG